MRKFNLWEITM